MTSKTKILFATVPFDGHFNPLTSLAKHLQHQGYEVAWYTGKSYASKLNKLGIPHYPFVRATEINQDNLNEIFPERDQIQSPIGKIKFDIKHAFVRPAEPYFEDIKELYQQFPFDIMVGEPGMTCGQLVKEILGKPVISIGVMPLMETSKDLYPNGLALPPRKDFLGKLHQSVMRFVSKNILFKESTNEYNRILTRYGLKPVNTNIFDIAVRVPDYYLQIGSPGFEYHRSDLSPNVRFIGSLLPYSSSRPKPFLHEDKLNKYNKVLLVSQGTVDNKEPEKLMVPTMEAYKNSPFLVIAATGGLHTEELRKRFPQDNIIVEDFVDYHYIMPKTDVFVTCGGYGSVMLSIANRLPMVAAGVHEGKNEINARIGYYNLGINLKTERPSPEQIQNAVRELLTNDHYKQNIERLRGELIQYETFELCEQYIQEALAAKGQPFAVAPSVPVLSETI